MLQKLRAWLAPLVARIRAWLRVAWLPENRKRTIRRALMLLGAALLVWLALWLLARPIGMRHYLVLGRDGWGIHQDDGRTDAMAVITLDYTGNRVLFTSFLRDTKIKLPQGGENRLNTLAQYHGDQALKAYLEQQYHIKISGVVSANFTAMVYILDALGGVTITITKQEANYLREHAGDYPGYALHEGDCLLNGAQALAYMRCRMLDDDGGRVNRQSMVVQALMKSRLSVGKVLRAVKQLSGSYATDLSLGEQLSLVRDAFSLRRAELVRFQIPAPNTFRYGGDSMLVIDEEKNQQLYQKLLDDAMTEEDWASLTRE